MYLLDTNVISELRKASNNKAHPNVLAWASEQEASSLYISAITLMELEMGILAIERKDTHQGTRLRHWMQEQVLPEFADRTLAIDTRVALRCAQLHIPDRRSERDALIAATALIHNMTVVTRNTADFLATHVALVNPWNR